MKVNVADYANLALLAVPPALRERLERAERVATEQVPPDVVTMQTRVVLADAATGRTREVALVYPSEADEARGRISVLGPLGAALLGACVGEIVACEAPAGACRLRVVRILYQPEHWMCLNLSVRE